MQWKFQSPSLVQLHWESNRQKLATLTNRLILPTCGFIISEEQNVRKLPGKTFISRILTKFKIDPDFSLMCVFLVWFHWDICPILNERQVWNIFNIWVKLTTVASYSNLTAMNTKPQRLEPAWTVFSSSNPHNWGITYEVF